MAKHGDSRIAGRAREQRILSAALRSREAELVVVYGRRRVGKTHLVREFCQDRASLYLEVTGQSGAPMSVQLGHVQRALEQELYAGTRLPALRTWEEAFDLLATALERRPKRAGSAVVFLDELPWLATRRSRCLQSLEHVWNARLSRLRNVRLVLCGSAASFMLDKVINARGGLHNRVTQRIRLDPFTLAETAEYFRMQNMHLGTMQLIEIYMALGGVPHYLRHVARGQSAAQAIGALCFDRAGPLHDEYARLFASLFSEPSKHDAIVRALSKKTSGLTREEIAAGASLSSGGGLVRALRALEESDFVGRFAPFGRKTKDTIFRLIDEFTAFHLRWIERAPRGVLAGGGQAYWQSKARSPSFRAWAGYAFEGICLKHAPQLARGLGIRGAFIPSTWRYVPKPNASGKGAQVDLLFDRDDGVITLCEMKFSREPFKLSKKDARALADKADIFRERTKTRKDVQVALVTVDPPAPSLWTDDVVDHTVTADALFAALP